MSGRIGSVDDRPATNTAPEFADTGPVTRSIGQGTAAGRPVGAPIRATDADQGDVLTYSLSGTDAGAFDIDVGTGQLRTKAVLDYDHDPQAEDTYTVMVSVHDGFDASYSPSTDSDATIEVTITVTACPHRKTADARPRRGRRPPCEPGPGVHGGQQDNPLGT